MAAREKFANSREQYTPRSERTIIYFGYIAVGPQEQYLDNLHEMWLLNEATDH